MRYSYTPLSGIAMASMLSIAVTVIEILGVEFEGIG